MRYGNTQTERDNFRGNVFVSPLDGDEVIERRAQDFIGKTVISMKDGRKIGSVSDVMIDRETLEISGVAISKGNLFNREISAIRASDVHVWGDDVILVTAGDSILHGEDLPKREKWLYVSENIRGRYVVSVDGTRIGQISDVLVDNRGRITGYELNQVFIDGPLHDLRRIPADATHSLGKDVLVVNTVSGLTNQEYQEPDGKNR